MPESVVLACECGATVKCSDIDGKTEQAVLDLWASLHGDHDPVPVFIATKIRDSERARRRRKLPPRESGSQ